MSGPTPAPNHPLTPPPVVQIGFEVVSESIFLHKELDIIANLVNLAFDLKVVRFAVCMAEDVSISPPAVFSTNIPLKELDIPSIGKLRFPEDFVMVGEV